MSKNCCYSQWLKCLIALLLIIVGLIVLMQSWSLAEDQWIADILNVIEDKDSLIPFYQNKMILKIVLAVACLLSISAAMIICSSCRLGIGCTWCKTIILTVVFLLVAGLAVAMFALPSDSDQLVSDFCNDRYSKLPYGFGDQLKKEKFSVRKTDRQLLEENPMCTNLCRCVRVNLKKWPRNFSKQKYSFSGTISKFDQCGQLLLETVTILSNLAGRGRRLQFGSLLDKMTSTKGIKKNLPQGFKSESKLRSSGMSWSKGNSLPSLMGSANGMDQLEALMPAQMQSVLKQKGVDQIWGKLSGPLRKAHMGFLKDFTKGMKDPKKKLEAFLYGPELKIIKLLEKEHQCQGICKPSPFWFDRHVGQGPPKEGCIFPIQRIVVGKMSYFGYGFAIISVLLLITLILRCYTEHCNPHTKEQTSLSGIGTIATFTAPSDRSDVDMLKKGKENSKQVLQE